MKTVKLYLPVILLVAAIAVLPLTRGGSLPFIARAGALHPLALAPDTCPPSEEPQTCGDITVKYAPAATCVADDPAWDAATPLDFYVRQAWESYLYPQHVEHAPNLTGEALPRRPIQAKVIRNDADICFRLTWADATEDLVVNDLPKYADGVAIMIPFGAEDVDGLDYQNNVCVDSFHMGGFPGIETTGPGCTQNIVQWRRDQPKVRNMTAVGFSTSHVTPDSDALPVSHWASWANGQWTVIYKRPLAPASPNMTPLNPGHRYPIAFATWNGSENERDGAKFVTEDYNNNLIIPEQDAVP